VFVLYAVVIGIVAGYALGGRLGRLESLRIRWPWLAFAALAVQVVLFLPRVGDALGAAAPLVYVVSSLAVLVVILANVRIPGVALIAAGAACNLAAILANGGSMPASPEALASLGWTDGAGYSNSVVRPDVALAPLTDVFALPAWLPFANVFSLGDVLIAVGLAVAIAAAMRRPARVA
jgi:hypothetical protein